MTGPEAEKLLEETAAKLAEHFDALVIIGSWIGEGGKTHCTQRGSGNWYARQGMAHEFINSDIAQEQAHRIGQELKEKPDDGDDWKAGV